MTCRNAYAHNQLTVWEKQYKLLGSYSFGFCFRGFFSRALETRFFFFSRALESRFFVLP